MTVVVGRICRNFLNNARDAAVLTLIASVVAASPTHDDRQNV
jgi:hypothetical protein